MRIRLCILAGLLLAAGSAAGAPGPSPASSPALSPAPSSAPSAEEARGAGAPAVADKLRLLLDLVDDPQVRAALDARRGERQPGDGGAGDGRAGAGRTGAGKPGAEAGAGAAAEAPAAGLAGDGMAGGLGGGLKRLRERAIELAGAVPRLPGEVGRAGAMLDDMLGRGDALSLALFAPLFLALGFGGEALFRLNVRRIGRWLLALPLDTVKERVSAVLVRLGYGLGIVGSFALGSVGAMLPFDFTARFKQVLLALLLAAVATRLAAVAGRFLLAPGAPRFRLLPIDTASAAFLFRRLVAAGLLYGAGSQLVGLLVPFGFDEASRELVVDGLEALALLLAVETVARYPRPTTTTPATEDAPALPHALPHPLPHAEWRRLRAGWARAGLCASAVLLWCFALAGADRAFWLLLFGALGPAGVRATQAAVRHVMRPAGRGDGEVDPLAAGARRIEVVLLERGVRTLTIVGAAALLAHLIGLDLAGLTLHDTASDRVARGVIGVGVVMLVADLLWHLIVALIDHKLALTMELGAGPRGGAGDVPSPGALPHAGATTPSSAHAARLQTLLPIARNLSLAALVAVAGTMVLASLGVEIGPLIASAGVVGVAIGFGAQTLVKDIISGVFYLVDDAFRIGEYIQSGTYKGTVESFSLRSVKLRHQRGALYTIPFGTLGAVQNLSRDWVVDKIPINVPYDTDVDAVRRIMKRIGAELLQDAELAPGIIATLKLQGVSQFGDYAIKLQTKMTTLPGDVQFAARRRALLLIQREFRAQGIGFALPTVQVSGDASEGAAAQGALSLVRAAEATAAE